MGGVRTRGAVFVLGAALLVPAFTARAEGTYKKVQPVLDTAKTVMDERLSLPDGSPLNVTSMIVTIDPGEETTWHKHGVPLFIYILSGEVTVDYEGKGKHTFGPGDSFMEAMSVWHRGTNRGSLPVRILTVYMGSDKAQNVIPRN
jgi:quercetin dioxygenase-like cupin family protein